MFHRVSRAWCQRLQGKLLFQLASSDATQQDKGGPALAATWEKPSSHSTTSDVEVGTLVTAGQRGVLGSCTPVLSPWLWGEQVEGAGMRLHSFPQGCH